MPKLNVIDYKIQLFENRFRYKHITLDGTPKTAEAGLARRNKASKNYNGGEQPSQVAASKIQQVYKIHD
jgi:hypothetical protein